MWAHEKSKEPYVRPRLLNNGCLRGFPVRFQTVSLGSSVNKAVVL
jgi:hypothetical protein